MKRAASTFVACIAAMCLASACSGKAGVPRNLILVSLDTVGAKHLSSYGHTRPTSPSLDAFAAEGVRFTNVIAPAPWTLPSHASMLTGLYPGQHGVQTLQHKLGEDIPSLGSILGSEGFHTVAVVNCLFLAKSFGLAHGFSKYELIPADESSAGAAGRVTDRAIELLEGQGERRAFLFLHYFDVHSDYRSEAPYEEMFEVDGSSVSRETFALARVVRGEVVLSPTEVDQLERLYDAGIRQLDDELARLFARLEAGGWLNDSLVVITADHGEEFMEHGLILHGATHYREMLRVPLILRGPSLPKGVTVETPVSLVDIVPTVLSLLELPPAVETAGVDLRRLWEAPDEPMAKRWIFAEGGPGFKVSTLRSVQDDRYKLIVDMATDRRELYDFINDPGETRNLAAERPALQRELYEALDPILGSDREVRPAPRLTPEEEAQLRGLGYL